MKEFPVLIGGKTMKKNVRLCLILLCLILPVSCSSLAQIGETVYYVAPHLSLIHI